MKLRLVLLSPLLILSACTKHVEVSTVRTSNDFSGLSADERKRSWVAFDVVVPATVARSIRRWQLSNVTFQVFRCGKPQDYDPAAARLNGQPFEYEALKEPLPSSVTLKFYLPEDPGHLETNLCAALDARGYSPVILRGQNVRMPPLSMIIYHYDANTGRFVPT